ncbi:MAG: hypothetical protein WDW36_002520 [Sanguina aurantia]
MTANVDEQDEQYRRPAPQELVLSLARAKRDAIMKRHRQSMPGADFSGLLITCDQVVVHEGNILEKPDNVEQARLFINGYSRSPASTVGSTIVTNMTTGSSVECVDETRITFSKIRAEAVDALLTEGEVMWCAGALMVENPLLAPFLVSMEGGIDAVMGLCKESVMRGLVESWEAAETQTSA